MVTPIIKVLSDTTRFLIEKVMVLAIRTDHKCDHHSRSNKKEKSSISNNQHKYAERKKKIKNRIGKSLNRLMIYQK